MTVSYSKDKPAPEEHRDIGIFTGSNERYDVDLIQYVAVRGCLIATNGHVAVAVACDGGEHNRMLYPQTMADAVPKHGKFPNVLEVGWTVSTHANAVYLTAGDLRMLCDYADAIGEEAILFAVPDYPEHEVHFAIGKVVGVLGPRAPGDDSNNRQLRKRLREKIAAVLSKRKEADA